MILQTIQQTETFYTFIKNDWFNIFIDRKWFEIVEADADYLY